jgi:hypothetical protein
VATTAPSAIDLKEGTPPGPGPRRNRRSRNGGEENLRYFLGKLNTSSGKPELGDEAPDEQQALIKAFQKDGVIYVLQTYRVDAEVQDGKPTLVKRPALKQQG